MALTKISTGGVKDDTADEAKLKISNAPSNGKFLQYKDDTDKLTWADSASEGTEVKSTGESGTTKFLRVDGDGTCSWQVPPDTNTQLTLHDEDNFASNSATAAASQQSIKAYVDTQVGSISSAPQITANASGALAAGDKVIVNSNGTVSKIKNTYTEKSSYLFTGTGAYAGGTAYNQKVCHDSNNGKIYAVYKSGTRTRGEIVITDGSSNGWKTYQEFVGNDCTPYGVAWSETSQRGLIVWKQSTGTEVRAFKLDSDGDSVTFGTKLNVLGGGTNSDHIDISWDKTADKFLIVVGKNASDNFPDASGARNNTIAFVVSVNDVTCTRGTPTVMSSQDNESRGLSLAYDPDNNKHLAIYADSGNSNYLTAAILTISGTTVTANTEVAGGGTDGNIAAYDTDVVYVGGGDFVFYYHQTDNDTKARFVTVSGTTPSMGADTNNINDTVTGYTNNNIQALYDERTGKVAIGQLSHSGPRDGRVYYLTLNKTNHTISNISSVQHLDSSMNGLAGCYDSTNNAHQWIYTGNSNNGASRSYTTVDVTTNLSKAYIGTSAGAYADGAAATINVVGATDSNQSGLTAGVKYFINNDGTLSTLGGDTKVFAGTAVSASKIIVNEGPQDYSPMVLLEKKVITTTNGANIDFDGFVSDEYDSYILKIYGLSRNPPTLSDTFAVRLRWFFDNTINTSNIYYWDATGRTFGYNTSPVNTGSSGGNTAIGYIQCHLTTSITCYTGEMEFPNLGQANAQKFVRGWMGDQKNPWLNGQHSDFWGKEKNTNTSGGNENKCTGFRLYEPTNEFRGGTLKLYGLK